MVYDLAEVEYQYFNYLANDEDILSGGGYSKKQTTRRDELSALLKSSGWKSAIVDKSLKHIHDKHLSGYHTTTAAKGFSNAWLYRNNPDNDSYNIANLLIRSGVKTERAKEIQEIINPLIGTSYSHYHLIQVAVECVVDEYKPIRDKFTKYPHYVNQIGTVFTHPYRNIYSINLPYQCRTEYYRNFKQEIDGIRGDYPNHSIYFHTTNWEVLDIIMRGHIDHTSGKRGLDFCITPSFYISTYGYHAMDWGQKNGPRWKNEVGVLIFAIPNKIPKNIKLHYLEGKEWTKVTSLSRAHTHIPKYITDNELNYLNKYDFIEGDMVANVDDIDKMKDKYIAKPHEPAKTQIAIKSFKADEFLEKHLVACCYFSKL